jgi:D-sedoheptulose 7-phosphate isomerase
MLLKTSLNSTSHLLSVIESQIRSSISVKTALLADSLLLSQVENISNIVINAYKNNKKTLLAGNGGSAADAQHIAGELVARFHFHRPGLPSIALTTDTSIITAIANDYGYEFLFSRQVEAMGISTSGNSPNIIKALEVCKEKNIITVGLTGESGGKIAELCDYCIKVPSNETPRIQEAHILIGHIFCYLVEDTLFSHLKPIR